MVSSRRVGLADVLAGVDVDRHQRLGLVDDDVAAGLQPDLGRSALSSSSLMPNSSKIGVSLVYSLTRLTSAGWKRLTKRRTRSYSSSLSTQMAVKSAVT